MRKGGRWKRRLGQSERRAGRKNSMKKGKRENRRSDKRKRMKRWKLVGRAEKDRYSEKGKGERESREKGEEKNREGEGIGMREKGG